MGAVSTLNVCRVKMFSDMPAEFPFFRITDSIAPASLFAGDVWGVITVICSLSTNFVATMLIGYRAWCVPSVPHMRETIAHSVATTQEAP